MKKFKIALPILAIIVGGAASAFTSIPTHQKEKTDPAYYWFEYNQQGTQLQNQTTQPVQTVQDPYNCNGEDVNCAQAFTSYTQDVENGVTVYKPGTPASPTQIDRKDE